MSETIEKARAAIEARLAELESEGKRLRSALADLNGHPQPRRPARGRAA